MFSYFILSHKIFPEQTLFISVIIIMSSLFSQVGRLCNENNLNFMIRF